MIIANMRTDVAHVCCPHTHQQKIARFLNTDDCRVHHRLRDPTRGRQTSRGRDQSRGTLLDPWFQLELGQLPSRRHVPNPEPFPCLKKQSRLVKFLIYVVGGILWLYLLWKGFILFEGVMTALYDIKDFVANVNDTV